MKPRTPTVGADWLRDLALAAVRFYQVALRPLNPWGCKFTPSCSHYALEAIERYGVTRGVGLTARRLLRCRPGVFGGYDPVPDLPANTAPAPSTSLPAESAR